jgi:NitT/TauT family transport system substrate-binding protein
MALPNRERTSGGCKTALSQAHQLGRALIRNKIHLMGFVGALTLAALSGCGDPARLSLTVNARGRAISSIPLIIAADQGLFSKYGLNVTLLLPPPDNEGGKASMTDPEMWMLRLKWFLGLGKRDGDVNLFGGTPLMLEAIERPSANHLISIGSTDCIARMHIIGRKGLRIEGLRELAGMRIGGSRRGTTGFATLLLLNRMGWDPGRDIELVPKNDLADLDAGAVDAIFAYERTYSLAVDEGYPVLSDMSEWNEEFAGNSVTVDREWLKDANHREAARRLLMAISEAIWLYHQDPSLALRVLDEWNGIRGDQAKRMYDRGAWLPVKPYPCFAGHRKTLELFGAPAVQALEAYHMPGIDQHSAQEFYDDSLIREIEASGFYERLAR